MKPFLSHPCLILLALVFGLEITSAQYEPRDGLIFHFPLTETAGKQARDTVAGRVAEYYSNSVAHLNWANPGVTFHASDQQYLVWAEPGGPDVRTSFTLAAWVRSSGYASEGRIIDIDSIKLKTVDGKLALQAGASTFVGNTPLSLGEWHHVAVTYDTSAIKLYIDGQLDKQIDQSPAFAFSNFIIIGVDWSSGSTNSYFFEGTIRDARVYRKNLTAKEIGYLYRPPTDIDMMVGLWVGEATLNEVKEVGSGQWTTAGAPFSSNLLIHLNHVGSEARLLQQAILMREKTGDRKEVIVIDPVNASAYDGLIRRGESPVGIRFSSATLPLPSDTVSLSVNGRVFSTSISLPAGHPRNPFRHKYHPDLSMGRAILRTIRIELTEGDEPVDNTLTATLVETIQGIHKDPIEARGPVTLTRVSTSGQLR